MDPTVVICSACFNTQDHTGHSISMLVGHGSGGCCDCGDPEAFHPDAPRCGIHVISQPEYVADLLPQDVLDSMKETFETALDFVIDVFSYVPLLAEDVDEFVCESFEEQAKLRYSCTSDEQELDSGDWVVVLYNDEIHSYADVERLLKHIDSERFDGLNATHTATEIDTIGRTAIYKNPDMFEAIETAQKMMPTKLFCTVRTERDYTRETLAGYILEWFKTCISVGSCIGGDDLVLRDTICQVLAARWNMGIERADHRVELDDPGLTGPVKNAEWDIEVPDTDVVEESWYEESYIRLDWLLFFDCRFWKELRLSVRSIVLGSLLGGKARVAGSAMDTDDPWGPRNWKRITGMSDQISY
jgi:Putative zinc finger in N-recognin (UBR box)/ATP-dependent Clp protease adaptor protein ClpS